MRQKTLNLPLSDNQLGLFNTPTYLKPTIVSAQKEKTKHPNVNKHNKRGDITWRPAGSREIHYDYPPHITAREKREGRREKFDYNSYGRLGFGVDDFKPVGIADIKMPTYRYIPWRIETRSNVPKVDLGFGQPVKFGIHNQEWKHVGRASIDHSHPKYMPAFFASRARSEKFDHNDNGRLGHGKHDWRPAGILNTSPSMR